VCLCFLFFVEVAVRSTSLHSLQSACVSVLDEVQPEMITIFKLPIFFYLRLYWFAVQIIGNWATSSSQRQNIDQAERHYRTAFATMPTLTLAVYLNYSVIK